jgi:integrase
MLVTLTPEFLSTQLVCPPGRRKIEYVDRGANGHGGLGLYVEVRETNPNVGTFYVRFKDKQGTTRHWKIGGTDVIGLTDARKEAKRLRAEIVLGADLKAKKAVPTLEEFMRDSVFPHIAPRKKSAKRDHQLWNVHVRHRLGMKRLTELTRHDVQSLQSEVLAKGLAPATANHVVKCIRSSLNLAVGWGLLEKNPASKIAMLFEDNKKERYLTDEELSRLLNVLRSDRNRTVCQIIVVLMATGLRLNEALAATWADVELERRVFIVRAQNSKSRRVRSVPINASARAVLNALPTKGTQGPLWVNPRTGRRYSTISKQFQRIRSAANLPDFRIHDCRHFFASALVSSGRTLFETQQLLGHSSPAVTQRYAHLSTRALEEAAASASVRLANGMKPT